MALGMQEMNQLMQLFEDLSLNASASKRHRELLIEEMTVVGIMLMMNIRQQALEQLRNAE